MDGKWLVMMVVATILVTQVTTASIHSADMDDNDMLEKLGFGLRAPKYKRICFCIGCQIASVGVCCLTDCGK
ncbi:hypothetical protein I4U23_016759 [Adineta vaga]|nr:hypothetical protein I4U23_016759 [Adineta vaga]